ILALPDVAGACAWAANNSKSSSMGTAKNHAAGFQNHSCFIIASPLYVHYSPDSVCHLLAGFILPTRLNQPRVTNITAVPARERPILDDFGIDHYFDEDVEQRNSLKLLELVVADLAQLVVKSLGVSDLQQVLPHGVEFVALKHVRQPSG